MKSLSFFILMSIVLGGISHPVFGQSVRETGPFQAYERRVSVDLETCEKNWKKTLPNVASCDVTIDKHSESLVWNAGRIIQYWQYSDQEWHVEISIYHTENGYKVSMFGSLSEPEDYYEFNVAKKYIGSALEEWGMVAFRQVLIKSRDIPQTINEVHLGSVVVVDRMTSSHNPDFLNVCERTWAQGQCYISLLSGSQRESLLNSDNLNLNFAELFLRSEGFTAWAKGSGASDYKIVIGSNNGEMAFAAFKKAWLKNTPNKSIQLKVQKFSNTIKKSHYVDRFSSFVKLHRQELRPHLEECKASFKSESQFKSTCRFRLPENSFALVDRELMNSRIDINMVPSTVWIRAEESEMLVDVFGPRGAYSDFNEFWNAIELAYNQKLAKPILLMSTGHQ